MHCRVTKTEEQRGFRLDMSLKKLIKRLDSQGKLRKIMKNNKVLKWMYYDFFVGLAQRRARIRIQTHGYELLEHVHNILESESIDFFVDFGTLLGFIREGDFLTHDLDIDIGVLVEDDNTRKRVRNALVNGGCKLNSTSIYNSTITRESYAFLGIKFDVGFYETGGKDSICYLFYVPNDTHLMPNERHVVRMRYSSIDGVEKRRFTDITINIPKDSERLLEEKYGADWRIPDKNWVYWKTPTAEYCDDLGTVITH